MLKIIKANYPTKNPLDKELLIKSMFGDYLYKPKFFVFVEQGKIKGFGGYTQSTMNWRIYQIFLINVHPTYQNQGIGTKIMNHLINEIKSIKGNYKRAQLILLTTPKPEYYRKKFGFETLMQFREKEAHLMALGLEKN